jgi:hypothetical protein
VFGRIESVSHFAGKGKKEKEKEKPKMNVIKLD